MRGERSDEHRVEPFRPLARWIVAEVPGGYLVGPATVAPAGLVRVPAGADSPDAAWAAGTLAGSRFLTWARFPVFQAAPDRVTIVDARYALEEDAPFGALVLWRPTPAGR